MGIKQCTIEPPLGQGRNKEISDFLEFTKNEGTMYLNLWNTMKAVLRGKFIALNAYIKEVEKTHTSDLTVYLNILEQKEADSPRRSRT